MRRCTHILRLLGGASLLAAAACGAPQQVVVHLGGTPADALVTIDDRYVGKLGRLSHSGVALPAGTHRLTVEQVGFFPHDQLLEVHPGAQPHVQVKLVAIPD